MDRTQTNPKGLQTHLLHKAKGFRIAATAIILITSLILSPVKVSATDPDIPSPFSIGTPEVFRHIFETDDFLLVFPYDITYAVSQPSPPASILFTYRLMSVDGADTLESVIPYPYNNSGYGLGMAAIYFTDADAPTWGLSYIIRIDGNPMYWDAPPTTTHTLSSVEYCTGTTQATNRAALATYIMGQAALLEVNWGVKLYDTSGSGGVVLTSTGQTYFTTVISGLATACPSIMSVSNSNPTFTATNAPGTAAANAWQHQWDGTILETWMTNIGNAAGIGGQSATAGILLIIMVLIAGFSQVKFGTTDPAYIANGAVLIIGTLAGWVFFAILGVIDLGVLWYISHTQFWRNL